MSQHLEWWTGPQELDRLALGGFRRFAIWYLLARQWLLSIFQSFKRLFASCRSDWVFSFKAFPDHEESHPFKGRSNCWDGFLLKTSWLSQFKTWIFTVPISCCFYWFCPPEDSSISSVWEALQASQLVRWIFIVMASAEQGWVVTCHFFWSQAQSLPNPEIALHLKPSNPWIEEDAEDESNAARWVPQRRFSPPS